MKRILTVCIVALFVAIGILTILASISNLLPERNDSISIVKRTDEKIYKSVLKAIESNSISSLSATLNRIRDIDRSIRDDLSNENDKKLIDYHENFLLFVYRAINEKIEVLKSGELNNENLEVILFKLKENYEKIREL